MRAIRPVVLLATAAWSLAAPSARAEFPVDDDDGCVCELPPSASGILESGGWTIDVGASTSGNPGLAAYTAWVAGAPVGRTIELPSGYGDAGGWYASHRGHAGWRWTDGVWPATFELRPDDGEDMEPVGGTPSWYGHHALQPVSFTFPPIGARVWKFTAVGSATTLGYVALQSTGLRWMVLPAGVQDGRLVPGTPFTFTEVSSVPFPTLKTLHYEAFDEANPGTM